MTAAKALSTDTTLNVFRFAQNLIMASIFLCRGETDATMMANAVLLARKRAAPAHTPCRRSVRNTNPTSAVDLPDSILMIH